MSITLLQNLPFFLWKKNPKQDIEYSCCMPCIMYISYTHVFTKFILFDYDGVQKLWMVIYLYLIKNESDISMDVYNAHACTYSLNEFVM